MQSMELITNNGNYLSLYNMYVESITNVMTKIRDDEIAETRKMKVLISVGAFFKVFFQLFFK